MANKKEPVTAVSVENKKWTYSKGTVNLNFTLRVDIKQELKDCLEIVERFKSDLEEQLASMK